MGHLGRGDGMRGKLKVREVCDRQNDRWRNGEMLARE